MVTLVAKNRWTSPQFGWSLGFIMAHVLKYRVASEQQNDSKT